MSQSSSQISRSRTAVIAITGIAAVCGIYILYSTFSEGKTKNTLHRSNAIHRRRPQRQEQARQGPVRPIVGWSRPTEDAPLGKLLISWGNTTGLSHAVNLAVAGALEFDESASFLGEADHDPNWVHYLHVSAVQCVLHAAAHPLTLEESQQDILAQYVATQQMDLQFLPDLGRVVGDRDSDRVREFSWWIWTALRSQVSMDEVQEGITEFMNSEDFGSDAFRLTTRFFQPDTPRFTSGDEYEAEVDEPIAETEVTPERDEAEPTQGLKGLLYHIAEEKAKRQAYEHRGIHCEECGERPIRGVRWHCLNCPDFDLCSTCEATTEHQKTHVFVKIKIPLPVLSQPTKEYPLWYPGDPRKYHPPLNTDLRKRLGEEHKFENEEMDAHYDQFTCIANVPWNNDPNRIMGAIDRRAFNKALTSERWPHRFRPNALYDRMFAFYDTNNDGLIGFEEFVSGLAYLRGPNRYTPLRRALQGFDIDGDGYIDRKDFIRLFRAKYEIQKMLINTMIETRENEQTQAAMDTLRSSLPISSIFSLEEIPPGEERPRGGKVLDSFGDMQPGNGTKTILGDHEGWPNHSAERRRKGAPVRPQDRFHRRFSRFEEMLQSPSDAADESGETGDNHRGIDEEITQRTEGLGSLDGDVAPGADGEHEIHTLNSNNNGDEDESLNQQLLWQIVEDGFHEMLDSLFQHGEEMDQRAINSRKEREKWRREIDQVAQERRAWTNEELKLIGVGEGDPFTETAVNSMNLGNGKQQSRPETESGSASNLLGALAPTDPNSLERREAEIVELSLNDLLDSTGYSVNDTDGEGHMVTTSDVASIAQASMISDGAVSRNLAGELENPPTFDFGVYAVDSSSDPTMPQNRPNESQQSPPLPVEASKEVTSSILDTEDRQLSGTEGHEEEPSRERLEELVTHDERDRELKARGGPGRLSFYQVEELVKADPTKELKGLVTNWLEWASF